MEPEQDFSCGNISHDVYVPIANTSATAITTALTTSMSYIYHNMNMHEKLTSRPRNVCGANCAASNVKSSRIDDATEPLAFTVSCASVDGSSGASSGCSSTMLEICL